jgi:hypothetical protein
MVTSNVTAIAEYAGNNKAPTTTKRTSTMPNLLIFSSPCSGGSGYLRQERTRTHGYGFGRRLRRTMPAATSPEATRNRAQAPARAEHASDHAAAVRADNESPAAIVEGRRVGPDEECREVSPASTPSAALVMQDALSLLGFRTIILAHEL